MNEATVDEATVDEATVDESTNENETPLNCEPSTSSQPQPTSTPIPKDFASPKRRSKGGRKQLSFRKEKQNRFQRALEKLEPIERDFVRRTVHQFYRENLPPTTASILQRLRFNGDFERFDTMSTSTLYEILKGLKFSYSKPNGNGKIVEKPQLIKWRIKYLRKVDELQKMGKIPVFTDETWVVVGMSFSKIWNPPEPTTMQEMMELKRRGMPNLPSGKGERCVILGAGCRDGPIKDAFRVFKGHSKSEDYHGEMNGEMYEKWFVEDLLANLDPEKHYIVIDNAAYHSRKFNRAPTMSDKKDVMQAWLTANHFEFEEKMTKAELKKLIDKNKEDVVQYNIDKMAADAGFELVRLPPYHCSLNAIELIWAILKHLVRSRNTYRGSSAEFIKNLTIQCFSEIGVEQWKRCCDHIIKEEKRYWQLDNIQRLTLSTQSPIILNQSDSEESDSDEDFNGFNGDDITMELSDSE